MGHANAWDYTPKQLASYAFIANKRKQADVAQKLWIAFTAHNNNAEGMKKVLKEVNRNG